MRARVLVAIRGVILALADDPRPRGVKKLTGQEDLWRLTVRVDGVSWRIVYRIVDPEPDVVVTRIVRRDEGTYHNL